MAGAGVVAGVAGGMFASRYLQASLYGVSRLDPATYLIGGAITLVAALIGAYVPARRSSRVDPLIAIRAE
jgi:ABC-type antimicrobial peptide transport system permease subunit